jgi:hypothetical protein
MPERHRHHDSTERRKLFTITLESCSRSGGIRVHDAVETVITMSRNTQHGPAQTDFMPHAAKKKAAKWRRDFETTLDPRYEPIPRICISTPAPKVRYLCDRALG